MPIGHATRTVLEKAALDNGFSQNEGPVDDWLIWRAHAAPARLCITVLDVGYGIGSDHLGAVRKLESNVTTLTGAPDGFRALQVPDKAALHTMAGAIWRLARSLPDEPLRRYRQRLAKRPDKTEVERLRKERIGQDVFRDALMLYWDGACAVTGVSHTRVLRASHIIPWADCETDAERLNVHNGLLLAAHLDATFDAHLISFDVDGKILFSDELSQDDIGALGFNSEMRLRRTDPETEIRLQRHRERVRNRATTG